MRVEDLTASPGGGSFTFAVDESLLASMSPEEVRSAMRALGYRTQNELASAIGVSRSAVSLWLEGKVGVPRPVAMLLRMLVAAQRRAYDAYPTRQGLKYSPAAPGLRTARAGIATYGAERSANLRGARLFQAAEHEGLVEHGE